MKPSGKPLPAEASVQRTNLIWPYLIAIAALTFAAFLPALKNQFVSWDDGKYFLSNFNYRGLSGTHLKWMFTTFYMGQYSPLAWLSSGIDYCFWGMNPMGYHLDNLLIHCLNAVLLFLLTRRLLELSLPEESRRNDPVLRGIAAVATLFFSIHPLRVESVAWATERRDVLGGLFFILTLLSYLHFHRSKDAPKNVLPWMALAAFLLTLLSKASAIGLPLLLLTLDYYPLRRIGGEKGWFNAAAWPVWREKFVFLLVALPIAGIALYGQGQVNASYALQELNLIQRAAVISYGAVFYLWKTLVPLHLSPLYELPYVISWSLPQFYLSALAVVLLSVIFFRASRRWPAVWILWLGYLILFAPTSGAAQSGSQLVADRFSYFSCMGWSLLLGGGLLRLWQKAAGSSTRIYLLSLIVAAGLMVLGTLTYRQTQVWRTTQTLWAHAVAVNPSSAVAKTYYASALIDGNRYPEAEALLQEALQLQPHNADALFMQGKLASRLHQNEQAMAYYKQAIEADPHQLDARMNYALLCLNQNRLPEAVDQFQRILEEAPHYAEAHVNLGIAYAMQNHLEQAIEEFQRALELEPGLIQAQANLSRARSMLKK